VVVNRRSLRVTRPPGVAREQIRGCVGRLRRSLVENLLTVRERAWLEGEVKLGFQCTFAALPLQEDETRPILGDPVVPVTLRLRPSVVGEGPDWDLP
jgi:hypothetical protein